MTKQNLNHEPTSNPNQDQTAASCGAGDPGFLLNRPHFLFGAGAIITRLSMPGWMRQTGMPAQMRVQITEYPRQLLGSLSQLKVGEVVPFNYPWDHPNAANFLIKLGQPAGGGVGSDNDVVAFNSFCTHQGGPLAGKFNAEVGVAGPCPLHWTTFDLTRHGMVVIHSDIYPVEPIGTEFADIVLPAAAWGEHDASRCNGERRLRLFSKFYDAPGETKPDWWAISRFAQKMGFAGFDWDEDNEVFEEAARFSRGGLLDYNALVWKAKQEGKKGHEALRELGTTGIQCPIRLENGELVGTKRVHDSTLVLGSPAGPTIHPKWLTHFNSHSGKALFIKSPWELFSDFYERITPDRSKGEFWITNGRINEVWQSGFDDRHKPYTENRWPDTFAEINPADADELGLESGDEIRMFSDDILIQTKGFTRVKGEEISFTWLMENGHIRVGKGDVRAVAIVTEAVPPGLIFTNFLHPSSPANSLVHRVPDPITNRYRFKLGKGQIERLGESPYKHDFRFMSFKPRDVV